MGGGKRGGGKVAEFFLMVVWFLVFFFLSKFFPRVFFSFLSLSPLLYLGAGDVQSESTLPDLFRLLGFPS